MDQTKPLKMPHLGLISYKNRPFPAYSSSCLLIDHLVNAESTFPETTTHAEDNMKRAIIRLAISSVLDAQVVPPPGPSNSLCPSVITDPYGQKNSHPVVTPNTPTHRVVARMDTSELRI